MKRILTLGLVFVSAACASVPEKQAANCSDPMEQGWTLKKVEPFQTNCQVFTYVRSECPESVLTAMNCRKVTD